MSASDPASERTPLLPPSPSAPPDEALPRPKRRRFPHRPRPTLTLALTLLVLLATLAAGLGTLAILARSLAPTQQSQDAAVVLRGPDRVRLLETATTDEGRTTGRVRIEGRAGIDGDVLLRLGSHAEQQKWDSEEQRQQQGLWQAARTTFGRFALGTIVRDVTVGLPSSIDVIASPFLSLTTEPLPVVRITPVHNIPGPTLPLTTSAPEKGDQWLTPLALELDFELLLTPDELIALARRAWAAGRVGGTVVADGAEVRLGKRGPLGGWRRALGPIRREVALDLPHLPALDNLTSLVTLESYRLFRAPVSFYDDGGTPSPGQADAGALQVVANVSVPPVSTFLPPWLRGVDLPLLRWEGGVGWLARVLRPPTHNGGDGVSIEARPIARMRVLPFERDLQAKGNVSLQLVGELLSAGALDGEEHQVNGEGGEEDEVDPLEAFLASFLHGAPLPLLLSPYPLLPLPPNAILPRLALAAGSLKAPVPPPDPPIKPLRELTIEGMRIKEGPDGRMRASGKVRARVVVPGLNGEAAGEGVEIDVAWVQPDIFIYNGPVSSPAPSFLDDDPPPPENAFAHLAFPRLPAHTEVSDPSRPGELDVTAEFEDQALEVVSERGLREFVAKIILKGGALAGVNGTCDVSASLSGLARELVIRGVAVEGEVWVGRR